jgi:transcriptional antiterminator RfaH
MSWVCLRTRPSREQWALQNVEAQGLQGYCPIGHCKRTDRTRPLFPSYIFAELSSDDHWWFLKGTFGVRNPVMDGAYPARVSAGVIAELRGRERNGLIEDPPEFVPGQLVHIVLGPLLGKSGRYCGMAPHDQVRLLLQMFGVMREVPVPRNRLQAG